jgi:hypothetical protein
MRAEIRSIEANDIPEWPHWSSSDPTNELRYFTISIGSPAESGADLFQVAVATPTGIRERQIKQKYVGLVVDRFESIVVEQAIRDFVESCDAHTWESIVNNLRTRMHWEYEGYR